MNLSALSALVFKFLIMKFETQNIEIAKPAKEVYAFFADFNNFKKILPNSVSNWQADADHCSFSFDGKIRMAMKFDQKTPPTFLKIIPDGKAPFSYFLSCSISPKENGCLVNIAFEADLNPFMRMLAEKPLEKLVKVIEEKVQEIFI